MDIVFYIDMDGVLAIWNQQASEEDTHQKGYFIAREAERSAITLVRLLVKKGFKVKILSAVYEDDHSAEEKRLWLTKEGLGDIEAIFVPYGEDKYKYINGEEHFPVLIDDYTKNLLAWEAHGFLPFKFMNGYNNQPKLEITPDQCIRVKGDSWTGYSLDCRMSPEQMEIILTSVASRELERRVA